MHEELERLIRLYAQILDIGMEDKAFRNWFSQYNTKRKTKYEWLNASEECLRELALAMAAKIDISTVSLTIRERAETLVAYIWPEQSETRF
jgi:ribosomal protein L16 Arg81 hydroxylase